MTTERKKLIERLRSYNGLSDHDCVCEAADMLEAELDVAIEALEKFANYPFFSPITSEVAQEALNKIRSME